jgi:membrane protein DedA with SNARE-associated domain
MGHWLSAAFANYGYAVVVLGIYLEGCGVPLPGETVLLAGGFFARQGSLSLSWLLVLAFLAALAGDNTGYWIGRRAGRGWVESHGRWVGLTPRRLEAVDAFFARHGTRTILAARFISGVRAFAPLFAGVSGIPWRRFAPWNAAGCLLWSASIGLLGYGFGESWGRAEEVMGRVGLSVLVLAAGLLLLRAAVRHHGRVVLWLRESVPGGLTQRQLWLLIVQLTVLGTLARIAGRVVAHRYTHFDGRITAQLAAVTGPAADAMLGVFAFLGSAPVVLAVALAAAAWCLATRRRAAGLMLLTSYLASLALSVDLSHALAWWTGARGLFSGLLSGNALVAATTYGAIALLLTRRQPHWRWPAALIAGSVILLIAWARIIHDEDLPSGVVAGLAVSTLLLLLGLYVIDLLDTAELQAGAGSPSPPEAPPAPPGPPGPHE